MKQKIVKSHYLLSASPSRKYKNAQNKVNAIIKEAKKKGYTIIPADRWELVGPEDNLRYKELRRGLVIYKIVDGQEIAYNPEWLDTLGLKVKL
jgi:hypothetical protein